MTGCREIGEKKKKGFEKKKKKIQSKLKGLLSACQEPVADKASLSCCGNSGLQEPESNFRNHKININVCKNEKVCLASNKEKATNV
jgi:hypothetical protein